MTAFGYHSRMSSPARQRIEAGIRTRLANAAREAAAARQDAVDRAERQWAAVQAGINEKALNESCEQVSVGARQKDALVRIVREVAEATGIAVIDIMSDRRNRPISQARNECFWRARRETTASYPQLGKFFHRDHTTVISGERRHAAMLAQEGNGE